MNTKMSLLNKRFVMKKFLLQITLVLLLASCGDGGFKHGTALETSQRCIVAYDEDSFSEMTKLCNRRDEYGLEQMEQRGRIAILSQGATGTVVETGFAKTKIRLSDNSEVWVANEFLKNK